MTELSIVPECYVDTKLAEILSQSKRKFNHQHGCGDVANQLKNRLRHLPALGIIDEDKNKGPVSRYFIDCCVQAISATRCLPENLFGFKKLTKTQDIDRNLGFYQFIKTLLNHEAPGITTLKKWLDSFRETGSPIKSQEF